MNYSYTELLVKLKGAYALELKVLIDRYQDAMNTVSRSVNAMLKDKVHSDITTDQFSTLHYIHTHESSTSTEIAQAFGVGKSAVTAQINRLFDKGLIDRNRDEKDRRIVYLFVTKKGIELVNYTEDKLHKVLGAHLSHFEKDEIHTFIEALEKLAKIMEK